MKFIVFEKANVNDTREPSFTSEKPLRETKRLASRRQAFRDSTMVIEHESGTMVAFKKPGERWTEVDGEIVSEQIFYPDGSSMKIEIKPSYESRDD